MSVGMGHTKRPDRKARGIGPLGAMRKGDKPKNFKKAMLKLIKYLGKYKLIVIIAIIIAIGSTAATIVGPKILGKATTKLFEGLINLVRGTGEVDFEYIGKMLLIALSLYIASAILNYIQGWIMAKISADVAYRLRRDMSIKIHKMELRYYDKTTQGEIMSRITNDVDAIYQTLSQSITQIITSTVTVIGVIVMMLTISWEMTLIALIVIPLSGILISIIIKYSQKHFAKQQEYIGHVNSHVEEMYGGHVIIKAFNGEKKSQEKFEKYNNTLYKAAWKSQFFSSTMMPITRFVGNLGYVLVAVVGGWLAIKGKITVGDIQAFIQYTRSFTQPIRQIANITNTLQQTAAAAERVFEFLEEAEEVKEIPNPVKLKDVKGEIEFRNVKFGYHPNKIVIHNFSAIAKPGMKVAIVGPTGAGKTTIVKLLMRFYDVNEGEILLDGVDIRKLTRKDLRENFAMVLQDTWLFSGTILENIRYGRLEATEAEVVAAAEAAYVSHFVDTLPGSYNMVVNEEVTNLSEGQKQLITIARAILKNPKILILDEATSAVDTRTELLIQKAMDNLMKNRTSFVIAHRLSTVRNADIILVIKNGDIVEQGTHEELLKRNGFYAEIYHSQFDKTE